MVLEEAVRFEVQQVWSQGKYDRCDGEALPEEASGSDETSKENYVEGSRTERKVR